MILESREEQKEQDEQRPGKAADLLNPRYLAMASVATSIDALAVGISLAAIQLGGIRLAAGLAMTAAVTALASYLGVNGGNRAGRYLGRRSEMAGGLILIGIGIKILIEHLTV